MNLPNDPIMLLSVINTQLRDHYANLAELCTSYGVDEQTIREKLAAINYEYDSQHNQFI